MDSENFWKIRETQINNCIISCSYIGVAPQEVYLLFFLNEQYR